MTALHVTAFKGEVPRVSARLIRDNFAQVAQNIKLTSGRIDPLRKPAFILDSALASGGQIRTLFHYHYKAHATWMCWDQVVDVAQSPIAQDERGRLYFSGLGELAMTTWQDGVANSGGPFPAKWFRLGVENPRSAPTVVASGGTAPNETRVYVWTWKTQYAEESGPSPAATVTGNSDGAWVLSGFAAAPSNSGKLVAITSCDKVAVVTVDSTSGLTVGCAVVLRGTHVPEWNAAHTVVEIRDGVTFTFATSVSAAFTGSAQSRWELLCAHNVEGLVRRIYRTSGTDATPRLVAEIPLSQSSYTDSQATQNLAIPLDTVDTEPPPKGAHSLVGLPNGAFAALTQNELCFSEPYKPHSWPLAYRYSFPATGVALSTVGNSVIVLTDGFPYLATATAPAAVNLSQIETYAPCVSKTAVVDIGAGCIYPGHDGLYLAGGGSVRNVTSALFKRDEWKTLNPHTLNAAFHDGKYYARHAEDTGAAALMVLDISDSELPVLVRVDYAPSAIYASPYDGNLYVAHGTKLYQWDTDVSNYFLALWKSKDFVLERPVNFAFAQVYADFSSAPADSALALRDNARLSAQPKRVGGALAARPLNTGSLNSSRMRPMHTLSSVSVEFALLKDDAIVYRRQVQDSRPFRLPAGFTSDRMSFYVSSTVSVHSVALAELVSELKQLAP